MGEGLTPERRLEAGNSMRRSRLHVPVRPCPPPSAFCSSRVCPSGPRSTRNIPAQLGGSTPTRSRSTARDTVYGIDAVEFDQTCRSRDGVTWPCGREAAAALANSSKPHGHLRGGGRIAWRLRTIFIHLLRGRRQHCRPARPQRLGRCRPISSAEEPGFHSSSRAIENQAQNRLSIHAVPERTDNRFSGRRNDIPRPDGCGKPLAMAPTTSYI